MDLPIFETKRLILKGITLADTDAYNKHFVDYEVIQHLSDQVPWPYPNDGVKLFIENFILPQQGKERWMWGIFLKTNPQELIGGVDLWKHGKPENRGFWLGKKFWGQGIMTEAVKPIMDYAFDVLGFEKMTLSNAVGNIRSRRVKEKTGAKLIGTKESKFVSSNYSESEIWEITKENWISHREQAEKTKHDLELTFKLLDRYLETRSPQALYWLKKQSKIKIPSWHISMLNDHERNSFYEDEIKDHVKGKVVLDIGAGAGFLTLTALKHGARHVYAIERDPFIGHCFKKSFEKEIKDGKVTLFTFDTFDLLTTDFTKGNPEVVVHEIFGDDGFGEHVHETFDDLFKREVITRDIKTIPESFTLYGSLHKLKTEYKFESPELEEKFWYLNGICHDEKYYDTHLRRTGLDMPPLKLCQYKIGQTEPPKMNLVKVKLNHEADKLRLWFTIAGKKSLLSTDKTKFETHWKNILLSVNLVPGETQIQTIYTDGSVRIKIEEKLD